MICHSWLRVVSPTSCTGQFGPSGNLITGPAEQLAVADIDGDNDMDVVTVQDGKILWYKNLNGKGTAFSTGIQADEVGPFYNFLRVLDVDSDGDQDLVFNLYVSGFVTLEWRENIDGKGNWSARKQLYNQFASELTHADMDADGIVDLVGIFQPQAGDLDKDGRPDLVAMGQNQIAVFRSSTGFSRTTVGQFDYGSDLTIGDFDNDGDLDLAAATTADTIRVLLFTNTDGFGQFDNGKRIDDARANCVAAAVPRPLVSPFAQPA